MGGTLTQPCWPAYVEAKPVIHPDGVADKFRRKAMLLGWLAAISSYIESLMLSENLIRRHSPQRLL